MPIYEYECSKCGAKFELRRNIEDSNDEIQCPECGEKKPVRVFSTFGVCSGSGSCAPSSPT